MLGALSYTRPTVAVALAVIVAGLLVSKASIHRFARQIISEIEVEDAIKFLVVAFVILPLLPDRPLGPYGVLNPEKIWLLVVFLTGLGWLGYIGVRALGPERGLLIAGLAGGFVSASATTASMGRLAGTATGIGAPLAGALLASLATIVQMLIVIGLVDVDVLRRLWPPMIAAAVVLVAIAAVVYRGGAHSQQNTDGEEAAVPRTRPFALRPALILAAVLTGALLVGRWGAAVLGAQGAVLAAFAAGLADAHAGAVAIASLAAKGCLRRHGPHRHCRRARLEPAGQGGARVHRRRPSIRPAVRGWDGLADHRFQRRADSRAHCGVTASMGADGMDISLNQMRLPRSPLAGNRFARPLSSAIRPSRAGVVLRDRPFSAASHREHVDIHRRCDAGIVVLADDHLHDDYPSARTHRRRRRPVRERYPLAADEQLSPAPIPMRSPPRRLSLPVGEDDPRSTVRRTHG